MAAVRGSSSHLSKAQWDEALEYYHSHRYERTLEKNLIKAFGINRNMVKARVKSKNTGRTIRGRPTLFSRPFERKLVQAIFMYQKASFSITNRLLLNLVRSIAEKMRKPLPKLGWLRSFLKRHGDVQSFKGTGRAGCRYNALSKEKLLQFIANLEVVLAGVPAERVYIMDESGIKFPSGYKVRAFSHAFPARTPKQSSLLLSFAGSWQEGIKSGQVSREAPCRSCLFRRHGQRHGGVHPPFHHQQGSFLPGKEGVCVA